MSVHISHETIYKRIMGDGSGELRAHCRHKMKYRRHVKVPRKTKVRNIPGRTSIHDRPAEADGKRFIFVDSYASWQKGAVENANKLVRQYMPKGTDFREISDEFVWQIRYKINRMPREKLNFSSPIKKFFNLIA